jgi:hypothetical protein
MSLPSPSSPSLPSVSSVVVAHIPQGGEGQASLCCVIRVVGGTDVADKACLREGGESQHRHRRHPHIPARREGPASLSSLFVWC